MSGASPKQRPTAQEVIQFVKEQVHLADLQDLDIDYEALARLDETPEDEAIALIDKTMAAILFT